MKAVRERLEGRSEADDLFHFQHGKRRGDIGKGERERTTPNPNFVVM